MTINGAAIFYVKFYWIVFYCLCNNVCFFVCLFYYFFDNICEKVLKYLNNVILFSIIHVSGIVYHNSVHFDIKINHILLLRYTVFKVSINELKLPEEAITTTYLHLPFCIYILISILHTSVEIGFFKTNCRSMLS